MRRDVSLSSLNGHGHSVLRGSCPVGVLSRKGSGQPSPPSLLPSLLYSSSSRCFLGIFSPGATRQAPWMQSWVRRAPRPPGTCRSWRGQTHRQAGEVECCAGRGSRVARGRGPDLHKKTRGLHREGVGSGRPRRWRTREGSGSLGQEARDLGLQLCPSRACTEHPSHQALEALG